MEYRDNTSSRRVEKIKIYKTDIAVVQEMMFQNYQIFCE